MMNFFLMRREPEYGRLRINIDGRQISLAVTDNTLSICRELRREIALYMNDNTEKSYDEVMSILKNAVVRLLGKRKTKRALRKRYVGISDISQLLCYVLQSISKCFDTEDENGECA